MGRRTRGRICLRGRGSIGGDFRCGGARFFARRAFGVRRFHLANQLLPFLGGHLTAPDHVLNEITRTFDRESSDAGGSADDVLHGRRDFAPGFLADDLRALGELRDSIAHVGAAMTERASWCGCGLRSFVRGRGWATGGRSGLIDHVVVEHGWARYLRAAGVGMAEVYDSPAATQAGLERA